VFQVQQEARVGEIMIGVLTGLQDEAKIIGPTSGSVVSLCGAHARDNLQTLLPPDVTGIVSFGVCGGLSPKVQVGDLVFGTFVTDGKNVYKADQEWFFQMAGRLTFPHHGAGVYSGGMIAGDTPAERHHLHSAMRAWTVDDESVAVAQFAASRGVPFAIVRSVSDDWLETVPLASKNATNPDGTSNLDAVLRSLREHPEQIFDLVKVAFNFERALGTLRGAVRIFGPSFLKEIPVG
jgi:adenosylhomocysteine nucleosidase